MAREALSRAAVAAAAMLASLRARVPRDRGLGNGHRLRPLPRGCRGARGRNRRQPVGIRRGQVRHSRRIRPAIGGWELRQADGRRQVRCPPRRSPNYAILADMRLRDQHAGHLRRLRRPRARVALGGSAQSEFEPERPGDPDRLCGRRQGRRRRARRSDQRRMAEDRRDAQRRRPDQLLRDQHRNSSPRRKSRSTT